MSIQQVRTVKTKARSDIHETKKLIHKKYLFGGDQDEYVELIRSLTGEEIKLKTNIIRKLNASVATSNAIMNLEKAQKDARDELNKIKKATATFTQIKDVIDMISGVVGGVARLII